MSRSRLSHTTPPALSAPTSRTRLRRRWPRQLAARPQRAGLHERHRPRGPALPSAAVRGCVPQRPSASRSLPAESRQQPPARPGVPSNAIFGARLVRWALQLAPGRVASRARAAAPSGTSARDWRERPEQELGLMDVVGAATKRQVGRGRLSPDGVGLYVMELQEGALAAAPPAPRDEGTLAAIAQPHGALDVRRNVTRPGGRRACRSRLAKSLPASSERCLRAAASAPGRRSLRDRRPGSHGAAGPERVAVSRGSPAQP